MALNEGIHRNERDPITSCGIIRWRTNSRPCIRSMMDVWISSEQGTSGEDGPESESHLRVRFHKISDFEQSLEQEFQSRNRSIFRSNKRKRNSKLHRSNVILLRSNDRWSGNRKIFFISTSCESRNICRGEAWRGTWISSECWNESGEKI